jgi:hypothetical protein
LVVRARSSGGPDPEKTVEATRQRRAKAKRGRCILAAGPSLHRMVGRLPDVPAAGSRKGRLFEYRYSLSARAGFLPTTVSSGSGKIIFAI